jgi:hypothetical protein
MAWLLLATERDCLGLDPLAPRSLHSDVLDAAERAWAHELRHVRTAPAGAPLGTAREGAIAGKAARGAHVPGGGARASLDTVASEDTTVDASGEGQVGRGGGITTGGGQDDAGILDVSPGDLDFGVNATQDGSGLSPGQASDFSGGGDGGRREKYGVGRDVDVDVAEYDSGGDDEHAGDGRLEGYDSAIEDELLADELGRGPSAAAGITAGAERRMGTRAAGRQYAPQSDDGSDQGADSNGRGLQFDDDSSDDSSSVATGNRVRPDGAALVPDVPAGGRGATARCRPATPGPHAEGYGHGEVTAAIDLNDELKLASGGQAATISRLRMLVRGSVTYGGEGAATGAVAEGVGAGKQDATGLVAPDSSAWASPAGTAAGFSSWAAGAAEQQAHAIQRAAAASRRGHADAQGEAVEGGGSNDSSDDDDDDGIDVDMDVEEEAAAIAAAQEEEQAQAQLAAMYGYVDDDASMEQVMAAIADAEAQAAAAAAEQSGASAAGQRH